MRLLAPHLVIVRPSGALALVAGSTLYVTRQSFPKENSHGKLVVSFREKLPA